MRHLLIAFAAAAFVAGLAFGSGPASAAPLPKIDGIAGHQSSTVEDVGYRYRGWRGYRPYRYRRPYYGYGYGYYRPYYRPYYRYWW